MDTNDIWVLFVACGGCACALQFSIVIIDLMSMHVALHILHLKYSSMEA